MPAAKLERTSGIWGGIDTILYKEIGGVEVQITVRSFKTNAIQVYTKLQIPAPKVEKTEDNRRLMPKRL